jgi:hypothetical protein
LISLSTISVDLSIDKLGYFLRESANASGSREGLGEHTDPVLEINTYIPSLDPYSKTAHALGPISDRCS